MYYVRDTVMTYVDFTVRSNHFYRMYHITQDIRINIHATHADKGSTGIFLLQSETPSNGVIVSKLGSALDDQYSFETQLNYGGPPGKPPSWEGRIGVFSSTDSELG